MVNRVVVFSAKAIYIVSLVLPLCIITACWSTYYGLGHYTGTILTISETVEIMPESRIFSVGMTAEALIQGTIFFLRDHFIEIFVIEKTTKIQILWTITRICALISPFSLMTLCNFIVSEYFWPHMTAAFLYFISSALYFAFYDWLLSVLGKKPHWSSVAIPWIAGIVIALSSLLRDGIPNATKVRIGVASICQYVSAILIALKCCLTICDLPKHGIKFSQKQ